MNKFKKSLSLGLAALMVVFGLRSFSALADDAVVQDNNSQTSAVTLDLSQDYDTVVQQGEAQLTSDDAANAQQQRLTADENTDVAETTPDQGPIEVQSTEENATPDFVSDDADLNDQVTDPSSGLSEDQASQDSSDGDNLDDGNTDQSQSSDQDQDPGTSMDSGAGDATIQQ